VGGCGTSCRRASEDVPGRPRQRGPRGAGCEHLNVSFEYIEGEAILYALSDLGSPLPRGPRARPAPWKPSHVAAGDGVPFTAVNGSVRFSLSRYTVEEDIDYVIQHIPEAVNRLPRAVAVRAASEAATTTMSRDRERDLREDQIELKFLEGVDGGSGDEADLLKGHRGSLHGRRPPRRGSRRRSTLTRMFSRRRVVWITSPAAWRCWTNGRGAGCAGAGD